MRNEDPLEITFAGRTFVLGRQLGADLVAEGMSTGAYEAPLPMLLMATLARKPGLFLDVGANNGIYSILAAKTRDDIRVMAFEPYSPVTQILRDNIIANRLENQVDIFELALSDHTGSASLHIPDPAHGLVETSASLEPDFKPVSSKIQVETKTLDVIPAIDDLVVIKVDIEGHEAAFLRGANKVIERNRPVVFAEMLSGASASFAEISIFFHKLDYTLFRLRPQCAIASSIITFDPWAWNYACVPKEGLPLFLECCATHGLDVFRAFEW